MSNKLLKVVKKVFNEVSESFEIYGKAYGERFVDHK